MSTKLMNSVIQVIENKPSQFNIGDFAFYDVYSEEWEFCIAGWAIVFGTFDGNQDEAGDWIECGPVYDIANFASDLLECSPDLFFPSQWPEELRWQMLEDTKPETIAKIAIEAIKHYSTENTSQGVLER